MTKILDGVDFGGSKGTNAADPTVDSDVATRGWVNAVVAAIGGLDSEAVQDIVGAMIAAGSNIDVAYDDAAGTFTISVEALTSADLSDFATAAVAAVNAGVIDADTLGGSTLAQVITAAIAGVVDTAPGTLDTLNELAAALGDDPNFAATVNAALAARTQKFSATIGDGAATSFNVDHNLGSRDVVVNVYDTGTNETVYIKNVRSTANRVIVGPFPVAPAAGAYRVVVVG